MAIPSRSGKFTLEDLKNVKSVSWSETRRVSLREPQIFVEEKDGFKFDYLWHPNANADHKRLFVLFSGDAMRKTNDPPVFQRWSWAKFFPGHCLFVSDPTLYLNDRLGLAWYAGNSDFDPMPHISATVNSITEQLNIKSEHVCTYGSSGGGFASIRALLFLPDALSVAINPQTCITKYEKKSVERYLRLAYDTDDRALALKKYHTRLNLLEHAETLRSKKILLIQNRLDTHHYEEHYKPLCEVLGYDVNQKCSDDMHLQRLLFSHEAGHGKAEPQEVFSQAMEIIIRWSS
ncbi:hypothetical protein [Roseibium sp.]|uniref:hypothetical protein n=1 Tax=Roseibium sp. TaxID=1936156 RepID=UPI003B507000